MTGGLADSVIARVVRQRDLLQSMSEHWKSISARVSSRDQLVAVEVDGMGAMTGLWLADGVDRLGADRLAALIVETGQAAAAVAQQRQNYLINEFNERMANLQGEGLRRWDGTVFTPTRAD